MKKQLIRCIALTLVFCLLLTFTVSSAATQTQDGALLSYEDAVEYFGIVSLTDEDALDLLYRSFNAIGTRHFAPQYKYLTAAFLNLCKSEIADFDGIEAALNMLKQNDAFISDYMSKENLSYLTLDELLQYVQARRQEADGIFSEACRLYMESQMLDSLDRAFDLTQQGYGPDTASPTQNASAEGTDIENDSGISDAGSLVSDDLSTEFNTDAEPISFPNQEVEDVARESVGIEVGDIYPSDVASITTLHLAEMSITDISFLQYFTGLEILYLFSNMISDISPLQNLVCLKSLNLADNQIDDVASLQNLTSLMFLFLDHNPITEAQITTLRESLPMTNGISYTHEPTADLVSDDITATPGSIALGDTVYFDTSVRNEGTADSGVFNIKWSIDGVEMGYGMHCGIAAGENVLDDSSSQFSWSPETPGKHTIRFEMDVDNHIAEENEDNNVSEIEVEVSAEKPISFPSQVVEAVVRDAVGIETGAIYPSDVALVKMLYLMNVSTSDISFLQYFSGVQRLYLQFNTINDTSSLEDLTNLTFLNLANNAVDDITPLENVTSLRFLYLDGNPITEAQITTLRESLPMINSISYTHEPTADLVSEDITATPGSIELGDTFYFDTSVRNEGTADSGIFNIKWFIDGAEMGYGMHCGIAAGETVLDDSSSELVWTPKAVGTFTIRFEADADQFYDEDDEENNVSQIDVEVYEKTLTPRTVYGAWGSWSTTPAYARATLDVETKTSTTSQAVTKYKYSRWLYTSTEYGDDTPTYTEYTGSVYLGNGRWEYKTAASPIPFYKTYNYTHDCYKDPATGRWFNQEIVTENVIQTVTQYRYRTITIVYD